MADTSSFSKFVPGFEFLENLVKNAGSALPSMGQWVVPTLDPEELDRRIKDLRTVQFWLDQNSRMLATTIQALEVQRMTLSALKGMNVTVNEMHEALKVRPTPAPSAPAGTPSTSAPAAPAAAPAGGTESAPPAAVVDAMQWWGALTQQFTQLASQAMQAAGEVAGPAAGAKNAANPAKGGGAAAGSKAASGAAKSTSSKRASAPGGNPTGRKTR